MAPAAAIPTPLSPEHHTRLLELFHSPDISLPDIAASLQISLHQLTTFLSSDSGAALIANAEHAHTLRARLLAATHLPRVVNVLADLLTQTHEDLKHAADPVRIPSESAAPATPDAHTHFRHAQLRETQRANTRRTAQALLRIARTRTAPLCDRTGVGHASRAAATQSAEQASAAEQTSIPADVRDFIRAAAERLTAERYPGWSPSSDNVDSTSPDDQPGCSASESGIHANQTCNDQFNNGAPASQPCPLSLDLIEAVNLTPHGAHAFLRHHATGEKTPLSLALAAGVPP